MFSSLVVLKLQLHSTIVIGICCSNFHNVLFDLYREGCGMVVEHGKFKCMQDLNNPDYRICCAWSKTAKCRIKIQAVRNRAMKAHGLLAPEAGTPVQKGTLKKDTPPEKDAPSTAKQQGTAKKATATRAAPT
jgi:hypothetical protein